MPGYCAICQYPAPCGRDHGEMPDGSPVKATTWVPDVWVTNEDGLIDVLDVDTWHCPHCRQPMFLDAVKDHIGAWHPTCLMCQAEDLVCAGILEAQARQRRGQHVS